MRSRENAGPTGAEGGAADAAEVVLYADGACTGNPGPGGWGAILISRDTGRRVELSGSDPDTTNNRMEMIAVIEGLRRLKRPCRVRVVTDSRYVVDGMKSWIHSWRRNGWKTADRKPVKNRELWEELSRLSGIHRLEFEWIRGHAGHEENERCDQLAVDAYKSFLDPPKRTSSCNRQRKGGSTRKTPPQRKPSPSGPSSPPQTP